MKKKSTLFALIAVACIAVALYFMYRETKETYDVGYDEPEETPEDQPEDAPEAKAIPITPADNEQTE